MLTGVPPFYTSDRELLYDRIKNKKLEYPSNFSDACASFLSKLFMKDPEKRLCSTKKIKEDPWFANVNWNALINKQVLPPFIPILKSDEDYSNFSPVNLC